jgi:hypothetical protein
MIAPMSYVRRLADILKFARLDVAYNARLTYCCEACLRRKELMRSKRAAALIDLLSDRARLQFAAAGNELAQLR